MKWRFDLAFWLLVAALGLAPWLGGRIVLELQPVEPAGIFHEAIGARMMPSVSQAVICALIVVGFLVGTLREQVLMLPNPRFIALLTLFWLWLGVSVITSKFPYDSMSEFARWTLYALALVASTMTLGRSRRVFFALGAVFLGTCVVAADGVYEYLRNSGFAPNWRIISGWQNPNALAGMLALVIPVGLGFCFASINKRRGSIPWLFIGASFGVAFCGSALWLTASKGGLLSLVIGLVAFGLFVALQVWRTKRAVMPRGWPIGIVAPLALAVSIVLAAYAPVSGEGPGGESRLFAAQAEAEQSVGFRNRLWRDGWRMATALPIVGAGIGTFDAAFAQFSTTAGSALAHNSYIQMAAEAGFPGLMFMLVVAGFWFYLVLKPHSGTDAEFSILRCAIAASVVAGGANAIVESSFSYFGFSLILFAFMGIGLLLAADGARPERLWLAPRIIASLGFCAACAYTMVFGATADIQVSIGLHEMRNGRISEADERFNSASRAIPSYFRGYLEKGKMRIAIAKELERRGHGDEAREEAWRAAPSLQTAMQLRPTASIFATYADAMALSGSPQGADAAYNAAINLAPASSTYRRRYFEFLQTQDGPQAMIVASGLIALEGSDYYRYTALPWLVNTDSVGARVYVASAMQESERTDMAIQLLEGAFKILVDFRRKTYSELKRMTGGDPRFDDLPLGGISLNQARKKMVELEDVVRRLSELYAKRGDETRMREIAKEMDELRTL